MIDGLRESTDGAANFILKSSTCAALRAFSKGSRVVLNTMANDYRLIVLVHYESGIKVIRFFGTSVPGKSGKAHCPA
jgi:RelE-like HigB toxin of type II HigAB toxin-antitoxin system